MSLAETVVAADPAINRVPSKYAMLAVESAFPKRIGATYKSEYFSGQ
jgi:hypothetical protein